MIKVTVQKNLIAMEDLLLGTGTASQVRGPTGSAPTTVTKINGGNFPYDDTHTLRQKMDELQEMIDSLPVVVDADGNLLTGYLDTSTLDLGSLHPGRMWRKSGVSGGLAEIYYGTVLLFQYNETTGNIVVPPDTDYIAADAVVTAAFQAADATLQGNIDALSASLGTAATFDVGTAAHQLVELDGSARLPAIDGSLLTGITAAQVTGITTVQTGMISYWPTATCPAGYLECDGSAVSRSTYAALFAVIGVSFGAGDGSTTFQLPDLRGQFVRGWDNSRGLDAGRSFGSSQSDAFESHTHGLNTGNICHQGSSYQFDGGGGSNRLSYATVSTTATGDTETRPTNVALLTVIKT